MKFLLLLAGLTITTALFAQDIPTNYKVYDVKKQKIISIEDIVSDMNHADVLFFGEEHNDSIGHYLEAEIFKKLNEKYPQQVALSMEMFHTDVQPIINEYLSGLISEKNFVKESRAWSNYKDYRPLIEYAKEKQLAVIGANVSARYSNAVTLNGLASLENFNEESKKFFPPLPIDTATGKYYENFTKLLGGHGMGTMKIYQTQNFWDATMAWSISKFKKMHKNIKILQLNGRFHSDEKLGTLAKLQQNQPKLRILNISSFSDSQFEQPNWDKFKNLGDYIILTNPELKRSY
ncbi:ChaN family lipoprotein [Pedobacter sp. MW01-1-1]|uniref:ChaN family lipoprotein n=1 Tax=Pedobacter sp. MW01-1-1 TaxID=3383027 RepID=UPI003FEE4788